MGAVNDANVMLSAILYFVDEEYRSFNPNILDEIKKLDISGMLRIAAENKLRYYLCKRILAERPDLTSKEVETGVKKGEKSIANAKSTTELVNSLFTEEGLDFLIIKTYKGLPYETLDIDILIRDEHYVPAINALKSKGATETNGRFLNILTKLHLALPGYRVKGLLNIDLYKGINWWLPALDENFILKKPRLIDFYGVKCPIPSCEGDLLSLIASSLFTDRKITLLDFLYIKSLSRNKLNYPTLLEETKKYGWDNQFIKILSLIQEIKHTLYHGDTIPKLIKFPYTFPWGILNNALPRVMINKISKHPVSFPSTLANVIFHSFTGQIYTNIAHIKKCIL